MIIIIIKNMIIKKTDEITTEQMQQVAGRRWKKNWATFRSRVA